jgi:peptidoglycan biosynthesis protein MviN/MurJ (putative lipid II flippase)
LVISSSTVLSRILGLVRDVVIAHLFGASRAYDAYSDRVHDPSSAAKAPR